MIMERKSESGESLLLTVREVAKLLGISSRTVWRMLSSGTLPVKPVALGTVARWRRGDIEAFAEELPDVHGMLRPKPDKQRIQVKNSTRESRKIRGEAKRQTSVGKATDGPTGSKTLPAGAGRTGRIVHHRTMARAAKGAQGIVAAPLQAVSGRWARL